MENKNSVLKDPEKAKCRIFIGNLPICTKEELESICLPYGKPIASLVKDKFGFVQFESEDTANKTAFALNGSSFKSKKITVRNAASKPPQKQKQQIHQNKPESFQDKYFKQQEEYHSRMNNNYNDCEIIVLNKETLTKYAELIESRLKRLFLRVDLLFPNPEVPIGKVLANISSRGCLYAILVNEQNAELQSITVNILYDQAAEHRNMPIDDAINLIISDFRKKLNSEVKHINIPLAVPIIPATTQPTTVVHRHPEPIQMLLNLLADNMPLTVLQYEKIIEYLKTRHENQIKIELGDSYVEPKPKKPEIDPDIELQKKFRDILNKPAISDTTTDLLFPTLDSILKDEMTIALLKDIKVQNALDLLMDNTSLIQSVEEHFKF